MNDEPPDSYELVGPGEVLAAADALADAITAMGKDAHRWLDTARGPFVIATLEMLEETATIELSAETAMDLAVKIVGLGLLPEDRVTLTIVPPGEVNG